MRVVFLIPDLRRDGAERARAAFARTRGLRRLVPARPLRTREVFGGTLNLMRHCAVARGLGAEAVLATESGRDGYGELRGIGRLPVVPWSERRPEDLCVVPDVYTWTLDRVEGPAVAYLQNPRQIRADFDASREDVFLWTDSPVMQAHCRAVFPGRRIDLVPNVVDPEAFRFVPQSERREGELVAFPRKGSDFIESVEARYRALGGRFWRMERIHGLSFPDFARRMRTPQAFLASAEVEGCALPPQECMAGGVAVAGRTAGGANFCMRDGETALVGETPEEAARALRDLESRELRERLVETARAWIRRYFPDAEPARLWRGLLAELG